MELNADIGEGGDDAAIVPWVDRVSIACGGHVGDESTMARALELAGRVGVLTGAHPSYPDREGFGRAPMRAAQAQIAAWVEQQVAALAGVAVKLGVDLAHVKPHGALYNVAARDAGVARAIVDAVRGFDARLALIALAGSELVAQGRAGGLVVLEEAFADRCYHADGSLVSRGTPGALIADPARACVQALAIAEGREIVTLGGARLRLRVDTLCVHGDSPGAAAIAHAIARALNRARFE